jgi:uncharacterized phage protein (TIGR01671 family)
MKSTELEQQTNPPLLIASVRQSALLFRAWNRELKEMFWFDLIWGSLHNKGTGWIGMLPIEQKERNEIKSFTQSDDRIAIDPTNCDMMRYTGKQDKNGTNIFEGDILKTYPIIASDKIGDCSFNVMVEFNGGCFIANGILGKYQCEISEVIGNIYQNAELLQVVA